MQHGLTWGNVGQKENATTGLEKTVRLSIVVLLSLLLYKKQHGICLRQRQEKNKAKEGQLDLCSEC